MAPKRKGDASSNPGPAVKRRLRGNAPISEQEYQKALQAVNETRVAAPKPKAEAAPDPARAEFLETYKDAEVVRARITWEGKPDELEALKMLASDVRAGVEKFKTKEFTRASLATKATLQAILSSLVEHSEAKSPEPTTPPSQTRSGRERAETPNTIAVEKTPRMTNLDGWEILEDEPIGVGSFATVCKGRDAKGNMLACKIEKVVNQSFINAQAKKQTTTKFIKDYTKLIERRAYRDMKFLHILDHDNVIKLAGHAFYHKQFVMMMPLMAGTFWDLFWDKQGEFRRPRPNKRSDPDTVQDNYRRRSHALWRAWTQLLDACAYVHSRHVIHADIKIDNILYEWKSSTEPGEEAEHEVQNLHFKLCDFGGARKEGSMLWNGHKYWGNKAFSPPECRQMPAGIKGYAHPSLDVWSLYSVFFQCFQRPALVREKTDAGAWRFFTRGREDMKLDPLKPWFDMVKVKPQRRITMQEALARCDLPANNFERYLPEWWVDADPWGDSGAEDGDDDDNDGSKSGQTSHEDSEEDNEEEDEDEEKSEEESEEGSEEESEEDSESEEGSDHLDHKKRQRQAFRKRLANQRRRENESSPESSPTARKSKGGKSVPGQDEGSRPGVGGKYPPGGKHPPGLR